jgi:hypothetical protein
VGGRRVMPLKLVIMSATLDPTKFRNFFETCVWGLSSLLLCYRSWPWADDQWPRLITGQRKNVQCLHSACG